jgi:hypothetical protein
MEVSNFAAIAIDDKNHADADADADVVPDTVLLSNSASIVFEAQQLQHTMTDGRNASMKPSITVAKSASTASTNSATTYITRRASTVKALPRVQPDPRNAKLLPPQQGVSWHGRSHDGSLLAAREASMPRCLWIFNTLDATLRTIIVQLDNITCAQWRPLVVNSDENSDPEAASNPSSSSSSSSALSATATSSKPLLAFCVGTPRVYFWSEGKGDYDYEGDDTGSVAVAVDGDDDDDDDDDNGEKESETGRRSDAYKGTRSNQNGRLQWADLCGPDTDTNTGTAASRASNAAISGDARSLSLSFMSTTTSTVTATTTNTTANSNANASKVPLSSISILALQWSSDGKRLLLKGKEHFVVCDVPQEIGRATADHD